MKKQRVLYFVNGYAPTKEEFDAAMALPFQVCFRNAQMVSADHTVEPADAVGGAIPRAYKDMPTIDELLEKLNGEQTKVKRRAKSVSGDKVAPVITVEPTVVVSEATPIVEEGDLAAAAGWAKN